MYKYILGIIILCIIGNGFMSCHFLSGKTGPNPNRQVEKPMEEPEMLKEKCFYETIPGDATITRIAKVKTSEESLYGFEEYAVYYKFRPYRNSLAHLTIGKTFRHYIKMNEQGINPGKKYIEKYKIKEGKEYQMSMKKLKSGVCKPFEFKSDLLPNDYIDVRMSHEETVFENYGLVKHGGCQYDTIRGHIKILNIKKAPLSAKDDTPYQGYEVEYKFIPKERISDFHKAEFEVRTFRHFLFYENQPIYPSMSYLKRHNIKEGVIFSGQMLIAAVRGCTPYVNLCSQMPVEDLTELYQVALNSNYAKKHCYFDTLVGMVHVIGVYKVKEAVESELNYDEYEILYQFFPLTAQGIKPVYRDLIYKVWTHKLSYNGKEVNPGLDYINKYILVKGRQMAAQLRLNRHGVCAPYDLWAEYLPTNDLAEIHTNKNRKVAKPVAAAPVRSFEQKIELRDLPRYQNPSICRYGEVEGYIKFHTIKAPDPGAASKYGYVPYIVKFYFTPLEEVDTRYVQPMHQFELILTRRDGQAFFPSKSYLQKYGVTTGAVREAKLKYRLDLGQCQPYIFDISGIPNDLFFTNGN